MTIKLNTKARSVDKSQGDSKSGIGKQRKYFLWRKRKHF